MSFIVLACCTGCPIALPTGPADILGPALAAIGADGELDLDEHCGRNVYNDCPESRPEVGTDTNDVTWTPDRVFFGLFQNFYHSPLDCLRGTSPEMGLSSVQCCYDGDQLVTDGPGAGSFDFFNPDGSFIATIQHFLFDVFPAFSMECP